MIHHHAQACGFGAGSGLGIDDAQLHPDGFGPRRYGLVHNGSGGFRIAKYINQINRTCDICQAGDHRLTMDLLPRQRRVDRSDVITMGKQYGHHLIACSLWSIGCANQRDMAYLR